MNILFYKWNACNENLVKRSLERLGHTVVLFEKEFLNYEIDSAFFLECIILIHKEHINCLFSINYIPLLSSIGDSLEIPYISWTQDSPVYPLYSPSASSAYSHKFIFDKEEFFRLSRLNLSNLNPCTLASDPAFFSKNAEFDPDFTQDISFVGNLYSETPFENMNITDSYSIGYIEGLLNAQKELYGINLFESSISKSLAEDILIASNNPIPNGYSISKKFAAAYILEKKLTGIEREYYLSAIGENYKLSIYTGSKLNKKIKAAYRGFADYETVMPKIFYNSKINLHFPPRNIHSGVSLRVFDVLACRGFLITAWCPELFELFKVNEDLVVFSSKEELLELIKYYLAHEDERNCIRQKGYEKICSNYTYDIVLEKILKEAGLS